MGCWCAEREPLLACPPLHNPSPGNFQGWGSGRGIGKQDWMPHPQVGVFPLRSSKAKWKENLQVLRKFLCCLLHRTRTPHVPAIPHSFPVIPATLKPCSALPQGKSIRRRGVNLHSSNFDVTGIKANITSTQGSCRATHLLNDKLDSWSLSIMARLVALPGVLQRDERQK